MKRQTNSVDAVSRLLHTGTHSPGEDESQNTNNYGRALMDTLSKWNEMDTIGKRIQGLRLTAQLSGAELARRVGIKPPSLWALENKEGIEPSGRVLALLCRELHTTPDFIIFGGAEGLDIEIEQDAAEVVHAMHNMTPEGRTALLLAARGLMESGPTGRGPGGNRNQSVKKSPPKHH